MAEMTAGAFRLLSVWAGMIRRKDPAKTCSCRDRGCSLRAITYAGGA